jgi:hypothetical protein
MAKERAQAIIDQAHEMAIGYPWVEAIDKVITAAERAEVNAIWNTLPGNYCFVDALCHIARTP